MPETQEGGTAVSNKPANSHARPADRLFVRLIALNPLLTLALIALLLKYGLPLASSRFTEGVVGLLWTGAIFALRPFSLVATWVDPFLRSFPEIVDVVITLLLGLLPYLVVDALYRRLIWRRR